MELHLKWLSFIVSCEYRLWFRRVQHKPPSLKTDFYDLTLLTRFYSWALKEKKKKLFKKLGVRCRLRSSIPSDLDERRNFYMVWYNKIDISWARQTCQFYWMWWGDYLNILFYSYWLENCNIVYFSLSFVGITVFSKVHKRDANQRTNKDGCHQLILVYLMKTERISYCQLHCAFLGCSHRNIFLTPIKTTSLNYTSVISTNFNKHVSIEQVLWPTSYI